MRQKKWIAVGCVLLVAIVLGIVAACILYKPGYKEVWKPIEPYNYTWDKDNGDLQKITARVNADCLAEKIAERDKVTAEIAADKDSKKFNYTDPDVLFANMKEDGSFEHIPYTSDTKSYWPPLDHLRDILFMQVALNDPSNKYHNDKDLNAKMRAKVTLGMEYWVEKNYVCSWNWWYNEVGVGMYLPNIILFGVDNLDKEVKDSMLSRIENTLLHKKPMRFNLYERNCNEAGGNLTDQALSTLKFCLAKGDGNTIMWVTKQLENELRPFPPYKGKTRHRWDAEGPKQDYSFQQHDQLIYIGGYGEVFMDGMNKYLMFTKDTQFCPNSKAINFYAELIMNGMQFATRNGYRDPSASGRGLVRVNGLTGVFNNVKESVDVLLQFDTKYKDELEALKKKRFSGVDGGAGGHRYFYESDYHVMNNDKYMASVRHASDRTRVYEYLNGENPLGYYTGMGATFFSVDGDEYYNLLPAYDWNKIPGTTTRQGLVPTMNQDFSYNTYGDNKYAAGISNGNVGMSYFRLNDKGVKAKKAYFMFEDGVVCLGADIKSSSGNEIVTNINQTTWDGNVIVSQNGQISNADKGISGKVDYILHDKIAYITDNEIALGLDKGRQGAWKKVNERTSNKDVVTKDVFTLDINHGKRPNKATYAYTMLMNTNADETAKYVSSPYFKVVANNKDVQAVYDSKNDILEAVFHKKGSITLNDGEVLEVSEGLVLIVENRGGKKVVTIASNDYREHKVTIKIGTKSVDTVIKKSPTIIEM